MCRCTASPSSLGRKTHALLHRDNANIIPLCENLRLQVRATVRFKRLIRGQGRHNHVVVGPDNRQWPQNRTDEHLEGMMHHQETSQVILEELQILLSLVRSFVKVGNIVPF